MLWGKARFSVSTSCSLPFLWGFADASCFLPKCLWCCNQRSHTLEHVQRSAVLSESVQRRVVLAPLGVMVCHGLSLLVTLFLADFFFFLNLALITSLTGHSASLNGLDRLTSIYGTAANFSKGTQSKKHIILAPRCGWCWGFKCHASIILAGLDQGEDGTRVECVSFRCTGRHRFAVKPQHREHRSGLQVGFYELQLRSFKGIHYCQLQGNRAACSI